MSQPFLKNDFLKNEILCIEQYKGIIKFSSNTNFTVHPFFCSNSDNMTTYNLRLMFTCKQWGKKRFSKQETENIRGWMLPAKIPHNYLLC